MAQLLKGDSLFFLSGKFDQVAKVPFSAFQFTGIVRKILSKSKSQVERWRQRLLSALGSNGQVVLDLIPELQELVGRLPPVQPLPPLESSHRLNVAMANLLETLASSQQSLLLFLDDVQWADGASLRMLRYSIERTSVCAHSLSLSLSLTHSHSLLPSRGTQLHHEQDTGKLVGDSGIP